MELVKERTNVSVTHLSTEDRMEAAFWCMRCFGGTDFWGINGDAGSFAFETEEYALAFTLRWG